MRRDALFLVGLLGVACKGEPDPTPFCSDVTVSEAPPPEGDVTYHGQVRPIFEAHCVYCHVDGGIGPFELDTYEAVFRYAEPIRDAVRDRVMPPWLGARCCAEYHDDWSLTDAQIAMIDEWVRRGAPEGDPAYAAPLPPPRVGLSRVDVTVSMPEPYTPSPPPGRTDDGRCFAAPWPLAEKTYITGLNPVPGNRAIVHHMAIAAVWGDTKDKVRELDAADPGPGWACTGIFFAGLEDISGIGGSLLGGDFPSDLGRPVEGDALIVFDIHYSTARAEPGPDLTSIEFKVDRQAREVQVFPVANLAWIAGGMRIAAGDPDAVYWYQYEPTLFTGDKRLQIWAASPHMHNFGSRFVMRIVRQNGERDCLLEIPKWDFGWEQTFWMARPKIFEPGDEVYVECHFDNSEANQPAGQAPRDIGWGVNDQDMCAGFVYWVEDR